MGPTGGHRMELPCGVVGGDLLGSGHFGGVHVPEEVAVECLLGHAALAGVQGQHVVKQVQGSGWDTGKRDMQYMINTMC